MGFDLRREAKIGERTLAVKPGAEDTFVVELAELVRRGGKVTRYVDGL